MKGTGKRRAAAMAMAVVMAASTFGGGAMATDAVYAAEENQAVKFPATYTMDLVQPIEDDAEVSKKVSALIRTMTMDEKFTFLGGSGTGTEGNAGDLPGVPRLGVPRIKMYDGPACLLFTEETTNPPQEQMLAATWDEEMAKLYGEVYSQEGAAMGAAFQLSAELDIQRHPYWMRTKDQMGEDPYLLQSLSDDLVKGMQSKGGIAVMKHFAVASDDGDLIFKYNQNVDEQTLHELYLPGFESAIKDGGALGLMTAYNRTNGERSSQNHYLLLDVLREMWNYKYFSITDWGGNHTFTMNDGTDIEMPSLNYNSQKYADQLVENGAYTREEMDALIDEAVTHILNAYGKGGYLTLVQVDEEGYAKEEEGRTELIDLAADTEALAALQEDSDAKVEDVAEAGGVLLKNENGALPLAKGTSVAVVGTNGMALIPGTGGERSYGTVGSMASPYEALCDILGEENVEGQVYKDLVGTIIPTEQLYTTADGEEHGAIRTYGTGESEDSGEIFQGQYHSNSVPEQKMGDHAIGEIAGTDPVIDFNTGIIDGKANKTYINAEDGNAFSYQERPAYTWTTYLEAKESGEHTIVFQSIGGQSAMGIFSLEADGTEKQMGSASGAGVNQGTQWYTSTIPSETGEHVSSVTVNLEAGKRYKVGVASANTLDGKDMQVGLAWVTPSQKQANIDNAIKAAQTNDTVVIFSYAGTSSLGSTREATTLKLDDAQQKMINDAAKAAHDNGHKAVVVLNNSAAIVMEDWIGNVDAILEMYYPGQRGGVATAKLLAGETNPSGKLAFTIPKQDTDTFLTCSDEAFSSYKTKLDEWYKDEDDGLTYESPGGPGGPGGGEGPGGFPGFGGGDMSTPYDVNYNEGIFTGYRWYDKENIEPQFDFGHGLSYTTFAYSDMNVTEHRIDGEAAGYDVTFKIKNTGNVKGSEVAQVYLGEANVPEGVQMARYQLAGYEKVKDIEPGETREATIHVSGRALSYWNASQESLTVRRDGTKDKWTVAKGQRTIYVGAASDDFRLQKTLNIEAAEEVKFPETYTLDLVKPETDDTVVDQKVEALVKTMTTEEKYTFLGGNGTGDSEGNAGYLKGVPRLGVPMIKMYDGPAGVLFPKDTTNPPQEQMLAATWDESMAEQYGEAVGNENVAIGGAFLLGAQLDIQRAPQFGRTKDQMGEDPYLLSSMADDLVNGMQKNGGIAVLKHYAAFAQNATPGTSTNVSVSEQALHEIYLPGFESAVKNANALGLMSSYNAVNGTMASANTYLQLDVLRDMWNYKYFSVTDWGGNDGYTLNKGTDIEMPSLSNNSQKKTEEQVSSGKMTQAEADATVDEAVSRVLRAYGRGGYLTLVEVDENGLAKEEIGRTEPIKPGTDTDTLASLYEASNAAVQEVAEQGAVLLKNENETLPVDTKNNKSVAVIGLNGMTLIPGIGGERSYGAISAMTSPYEALCDIVGKGKVEGQVYNGTVGTIIPAENLYTSIDGGEHGAVRTYGTGQTKDTGGIVQGQFVSNSVPEKAMDGHAIGEYCTTDAVIDFNTGTKTYVNGKNGTAFDYKTNPAYTWTTFVEAPEDGEYSLIFRSMGARAAMAVFELTGETDKDGKPVEKSLGTASGASANQGTQYYGGVIPSETGENLSSVTVKMEKGKRYKIAIASMNADGVGQSMWGGGTQVMKRIEGKDMQVGLAWVTPSQKQANIDNAIQAAKEHDTVVIFAYAQVKDPASTREATTLKLNSGQQDMINNVAKAAHRAGNKVAVVLNNDAAVVMEDWIDNADAILEMYYPGQRGGVATAELLTGQVNPSGKLAYTIPKKDTDTLLTYSDELWSQFEAADNWKGDSGSSEGPGGPGGPGGGMPGGKGQNTTTFAEGIHTGYRWYDANNIEPQYDFGYGLSYTTFAYSDMQVKENRKEGESAGYDVAFKVTNTGKVKGSEVAQVYLGAAKNLPAGIQSAKIQLAGYEKVKDINPGETRDVTIHVNERSLSYWNTNQKTLTVRGDGTKDKWNIAQGERTIYVGASSDQLLMDETVDVTEASDAEISKEVAKAAKEAAIAAQKKADEAAAAAKEAAEAAKAASDNKAEMEAAAEQAKQSAESAAEAAAAANKVAAEIEASNKNQEKMAQAAELAANAAGLAAQSAQSALDYIKEQDGAVEANKEAAKAAQAAAEAAQRAAELQTTEAVAQANAAKAAAEAAQRIATEQAELAAGTGATIKAAAEAAKEAAEAAVKAVEKQNTEALAKAAEAQAKADAAVQDAKDAVTALNAKTAEILEQVSAADQKAEQAIMLANAAKEAADAARIAAEKARLEAEAARKAAEEQTAEAKKAAEAAKAEAETAKKEAKEAKEAQKALAEKISFSMKEVSVKGVKSKAKKKVSVSWKKVKGADGYTVQYSAKADMKGAKKANVKKTSATLKKLKSKKNCYVRVRAYKAIGGETVYTSYSPVSKVKVK